MKLKKKILSVLICAFTLTLFTQNIFAQTSDEEEAVYLGITDSDCKNLAKNYEKLSKDLDAYGVALDQTSNYVAYDALTVEKGLETIVENYGISGPNSFTKLYIIYYGCAVIAYDKALDSDPQTKMLMKSMGMADPMASLRSAINSKDLKVIEKNYDILKTPLGIEDAASANADDDYEEPKSSSKSSSKSKKSSSKSNSKDDSSDDDIKGYLKGKLKDKVIKDSKDTIDSWF